MQQKQRPCRTDTAFGGTALVALAGAFLVVACGTESDLLTSRRGDGTGAAGGADAGRSGDTANGGSREGGAGGNASGGPHVQPDSGAPGGQGGTAGDASAGNAGGDTAVSVDPNAAKKKTLVEKLCSLLDTYPCLRFTEYGPLDGIGAGGIDICVDSERIAATSVPDACFTAWADVMTCLANTPRQCPCSRNDCELNLAGATPSACPTETQAYTTCMDREPLPGNRGMTTGSVRTCEWESDATGHCSPGCLATTSNGYTFGAQCSYGIPGGPQNCICVINGTVLYDGTREDSLTTDFGWFYADDCKGVAQKLSDGQCDRILNCCFTWFPASMPGQTAAEQCSCLSDPMAKGVSTCQEVAALGGGKVVDICPQYQQPPKFPSQ